jgi:hypothetical protein
VKDPKRVEALKHFTEEFGVLFEQWGFPRMSGRILGWLMVCDPQHQSAAELSEVLGASKGSISTSTRLLIASGLVERIGMPGERVSYYRMVADPVNPIMRLEMADAIALRRLMERGLEILSGVSPKSKMHLELLRELMKFRERELPKLIERFRADYEKKQKR